MFKAKFSLWSALVFVPLFPIPRFPALTHVVVEQREGEISLWERVHGWSDVLLFSACSLRKSKGPKAPCCPTRDSVSISQPPRCPRYWGCLRSLCCIFFLFLTAQPPMFHSFEGPMSLSPYSAPRQNSSLQFHHTEACVTGRSHLPPASSLGTQVGGVSSLLWLSTTPCCLSPSIPSLAPSWQTGSLGAKQISRWDSSLSL